MADLGVMEGAEPTSRRWPVYHHHCSHYRPSRTRVVFLDAAAEDDVIVFLIIHVSYSFIVSKLNVFCLVFKPFSRRQKSIRILPSVFPLRTCILTVDLCCCTHVVYS